MGELRWAAVVSDAVTEHLLRLRDDEAVLRRFYSKVDFGLDEVADCHIWTGALSSEGYGAFALPRVDGYKRVVRAHRAAWIWRHGAPDAEAPYLDHPTTCAGRFCLNLAHLEPVTAAENVRRGTGVGSAPQRLMRQLALALRDERRAAGEPVKF